MSIKEKPPEFFKSIKTSLKNILKHPIINTPKINDAVIKANKIVIHTLQFLKLYCLHCYDTTKSLPTINNELVKSTMKILCNEKSQGKPPKPEIKALKEQLKTFYTEKPKWNEKPEYATFVTSYEKLKMTYSMWKTTNSNLNPIITIGYENKRNTFYRRKPSSIKIVSIMT